MDISQLLLPILGVFVGFLVTFIGGGGGAIYIPLLVFGFGLTLKEAVPISLATMIFTSFFGSISHYKQGHIHLRGGALAVAGALIGTGIGTYISTLAPEWILQRAFGVLMFIMIYPMYLEIKGRKQRETSKELTEDIHILDHPFQHGLFMAIMIFLIGMVSGTSAGLFGVSGVVTLIVGFYLIGIKPKVIVGTSIFILFFKALSGFLWHMKLAHVNWTIVLLLALGTSTGGFFGPWVLAKLHSEKAENFLEKVFIAIIAVLGFLFLFKPI